MYLSCVFVIQVGSFSEVRECHQEYFVLKLFITVCLNSKKLSINFYNSYILYGLFLFLRLSIKFLLHSRMLFFDLLMLLLIVDYLL